MRTIALLLRAAGVAVNGQEKEPKTGLFPPD